MKKILALILALVMALSLVACGSKDNNDTPDDGKKTNTIKVGLICIGDENDQGYTYNFIRGKEAATEALAAKGINVEWVIKYNKGENDDCTNANIECAEEGCQLIINNSYGHEPFMLKVAGKSEYKDIQFIGCTNCGSRSDSLPQNRVHLLYQPGLCRGRSGQHPQRLRQHLRGPLCGRRGGWHEAAGDDRQR